MTYSLEFEINDLPKMANIQNGKSHWTYAMKEARKWNALVYSAVRNKLPEAPIAKAKLTCIRFSSKECDYDGLVRGFKNVIDGLRYARVLLDDKLSNTGAWNCMWVKVKPKEGKIWVRVEEVNDPAIG